MVVVFKILKIAGIGVLGLTLGFGILLINNMREHGHLTDWSKMTKKEEEQLRKELPHCTYQELHIEFWKRKQRETDELLRNTRFNNCDLELQWWKDQYERRSNHASQK